MKLTDPASLSFNNARADTLLVEKDTTLGVNERCGNEP
jgi:hypothetical protein